MSLIFRENAETVKIMAFLDSRIFIVAEIFQISIFYNKDKLISITIDIGIQSENFFVAVSFLPLHQDTVFLTISSEKYILREKTSAIRNS